MRSIEWAAGLFEGEGTIVVRRRGENSCTLQLSLYSTDPDVAHAFCEAVEAGSVKGPYSGRSNPSGIGPTKDMYQWYAFGTNGKEVLKKLKPFFLSRRAAKAEEALRDCYG